MHGPAFDQLTREIANGHSRRAVIKVFAGAAGGLVAGLGIRTTSATDTRVWICHLTGSATTPVVYIGVSEASVAEHAAHGDGVDLLTDRLHCGACGNRCSEGQHCAGGECQGDTCSPLNSACTVDADCCADLQCCPNFTCQITNDNCDGLD